LKLRLSYPNISVREPLQDASKKAAMRLKDLFAARRCKRLGDDVSLPRSQNGFYKLPGSIPPIDGESVSFLFRESDTRPKIICHRFALVDDLTKLVRDSSAHVDGRIWLHRLAEFVKGEERSEQDARAEDHPEKPPGHLYRLPGLPLDQFNCAEEAARDERPEVASQSPHEK
jgi:hypothetical protein